jgi:AcrR family transcriptional regulator
LERRKARAMEVATELFIERGYSATTIVDIADQAGIATRTLYQHFGDKESIFREVIFARGVTANLERPHLEEGDTLFSALRRTCDYCYAVTTQEKAMGLMRLMIAEGPRFPEFISSVAASVFARFLGDIEKAFIALEGAGLIPHGDHARSAELFQDMAQGSHPIMVYTNWNTTLPDASDLDERVELFILGRFGPAVARAARTKTAKRTQKTQSGADYG